METTVNEPVATGEAAEFAAATAYIPETVSLGAETAAAQAEGVVTGPVEPAGLTLEMMQMVIGLPFAAMASSIGKDGEFWRLSDEEKQNLAVIFLPLINPIWIRWAGESGGPWILAAMMTAATVGPRLAQEKTRRESLTESTVTVSVGDSPSSPGQPVPVNQRKPIDLSATLEE